MPLFCEILKAGMLRSVHTTAAGRDQGTRVLAQRRMMKIVLKTHSNFC